MRKLTRKKDDNMVEKITITTKTIEYDYSYEENDLVHLEMNLIELPIFNKNSRIQKNTSIIYNFNKDKSSYLQVKPGYNLSIPGEKEEKIFYALLKIFQKNNFLENKYCYTDYYEIIKEMDLVYSGRTKQQVRTGLEILRETHYEFQNSFYTKLEGEHYKASFNELKKLLNITFITFDKTSSEEEKNLFTNNKKEIIKIELSDFIKQNILNKIFLYFSKQDLLSLENAVTRNLWIKFTKWRNGKLFLKISSKNIATKVPLSWTPSTYSKTILIIKKSLEDLKEKNLITHYDFINMINGKKIKNEKTYFEIYFDEVHNEKRNNFSMGSKENYSFHHEYDTNIEHIEYKPTEKAIVEEAEIVNSPKRDKNNETIDFLYSFVNEKGKKLSTLRGKIEKALKKHSSENIKAAILYTNKNSKTSYGKYFTDTLENEWYKDSKDSLIAEYEIKRMDSSEIKKKLEEYKLLQSISYAKKNQYVSNEWNSSVEECILKYALETSGEYVSMVVKLLYSRIAKALTKPLTSILEQLFIENSFDDFIRKNKKKKSEKIELAETFEEEKIPVEEIREIPQNRVEEISVLENKNIESLFDLGIKKVSLDPEPTFISMEDKNRAIKYLQEIEMEKFNWTMYQKRCEMGLENSKENINMLLNTLEKYDKKIQETLEVKVQNISSEKEATTQRLIEEDKLLKNRSSVRGIKEIFDEELKQYESIFREFSPDEKFKLKSMTLKKYLEEQKGNINEDVLKRIMSENVVLVFDL